MKAVEHASKIANLHEFVVNELNLKYQTTIGEEELDCLVDSDSGLE